MVPLIVAILSMVAAAWAIIYARASALAARDSAASSRRSADAAERQAAVSERAYAVTEADRADQEAADARLVFSKPYGGSSSQIRLHVYNEGLAAVTNLEVELRRPDGSTIPVDHSGPDADIVPAGDRAEIWLWLDGPQLQDGDEFLVVLTFTDRAGRRWERIENGKPRRV